MPLCAHPVRGQGGEAHLARHRGDMRLEGCPDPLHITTATMPPDMSYRVQLSQRAGGGMGQTTRGPRPAEEVLVPAARGDEAGPRVATRDSLGRAGRRGRAESGETSTSSPVAFLLRCRFQTILFLSK